MVIREHEVYKRITEVITDALDSLGISGVKVLQQHQPLQTNSHAFVAVTKISAVRYGWQGVTYDPGERSEITPWHRTDNGGDTDLPKGYKKFLSEHTEYLEDQAFQISAYHPRRVDDDTKSLTSYDIISALAAWLMSRRGLESLRNQGLQPLRITEVRNPVQQDDSNIPQFNPNFDLHLIVPQSITVKTPMIEAFTRDVVRSDGRHMF